jgi:ComEC/Rec2-related protein
MIFLLFYLWGIKSDFFEIQSTKYPTGRQQITIRLIDLRMVAPEILRRRSVTYLAEVVSSSVDFPHRVMVNFYKPPSLHRGDVLSVDGKLMTHGVVIPDGFDYFRFLARNQIGGIFYVKKIVSHRHHVGWFTSIERLRNLILHRLTKGFELDSSSWRLITAVVLGERRNLTFRDRQQFIASGFMHLFAVSGMHVALVALMIFYLLGLLQCPYRLKLGVSPIFLLIYVLMTGASASSLRAFGMVSLWWIGLLLFRTSNLYYLLAICAWFQLLVSPMLLYDVGFQLSFLIVLFLIRGMEVKSQVKSFLWVERRLAIRSILSPRQKNVDIGFDLFYLGGIVFLAAFGLQLYYFRIFQPLTILTTTWSSFCASGIMIFSLLKTVLPFSVINEGINLFLIPLNSCSDFIFSHQLFSYVHHSHFMMFALYYILLLFSLFFRRKIWPIFILFSMIWLVVALYPRNSTRLYYANIKGSHIVVWIREQDQSAIVYLNGRSTQSAFSRLLAEQHVDKVATLWVGKRYTPTWRIANQYEIESRESFHTADSQRMSFAGITWSVKQNILVVESMSHRPIHIDLDQIPQNQFYRKIF